MQLELLDDLAHFELVFLDLENDVALAQSGEDSVEKELGVGSFVEEVVVDIFLSDLFQEELSGLIDVFFKVLFLIDGLADDEMGMHEVDGDVSFANAAYFIAFLVVFLFLHSELRGWYLMYSFMAFLKRF